MAEKSDTLWVVSNRVDDRVVLWERDPEHPGGEAFIGGSSPDHVARTGEIERLLREGLILEVPEPKDGPKKPVETQAWVAGQRPDMPGQTIKLGRKLDPALFGDADLKRIEAVQDRLPEEVAVPKGVVVPKDDEPSTKNTSRR